MLFLAAGNEAFGLQALSLIHEQLCRSRNLAIDGSSVLPDFVWSGALNFGVGLFPLLPGDSGEAERSFRKEAERHSGMIPNTIGA